MEKIKAKYEAYIKNMEWHIKVNKPKEKEREQIEQRISDFKEVVRDLEWMERNYLTINLNS